MVRVISEKLFSPPRSRHSSGETTDKELAARAVEALSSLNYRRLELSDYESSSDSHWDSEVDVEGDGAESSISRDQAGARNGGTVDVLRKRKERRRERNKVSAQAYRVRRKEQTVKQQTVLQSLQDENARLKSTVQSLEDEMLKVRNSLRQRGHLTSFALPSPAPTPTPTPIPVPTPKTWTDKGSGSPSFGSVAGDKFASFGQLSEKTSMSGGACVLAMDNAQSRQQQISPVVDNFLFSKPLTTPPSTGAIKVPSGTPTFSFPSTTTTTSPIPVGGARHNFNATSGFVGSALPTISEKPDDHFSQHHQHHPYPKSQLQQQQQQYQQHQQQADLNANANSFALNNNANMVHTKVGVFDMYNNSNRMNNNNHLFQNEEACGDRMAQQLPFKVCKV